VNTVGAYRLLRQIGEGGMGVVHLALAPDGSRVAVKILRPQIIGDREARLRLEREVAAMRRVRSPRVAECIDAEPWGDPPYVVTQYVAGLSLTEHVAEYGPLDPGRLHRFAAGTAEALAGVHAAGVLHRDVKPSNVLINRNEPVLIDFGLAMSGDESRMTHAGWVFGTPAYLAPEVVLGDAPTPAVDVHGWAATVAFAATGRSPHGSGPSVVVLDRIRRGDFTLTGVPEPMQSILHRCLDPQPHQRPSAVELCRWLQHLPGGQAAASTSSVAPGAYSPGPGSHHTLAAPAQSGSAEQQASMHSFAAAPPHAGQQPGWGPAQQHPGGPPTHQQPGWAPAPEHPGWAHVRTPASVRALQWAAGSASMVALAAASAIAPYVATAVALVVLTIVQAAFATADRRRRKESRRGPKGHDGFMGVLMWPMRVLGAAPAALVSCGLALGVAMTISAVQTVAAGAPRDAATVLGGVAFAALLWWGPARATVRRAGVVMTRAVLTPPVAGVVTVSVLVVAALVLLVIANDTPTSWAPFGGSAFGWLR